MSLDTIIQKILDDARSEASRIMEEVQEKASGIMEKARNEALRQKELVLAEARREGELEASRLITEARLKGRIAVLTTKKELIGAVLDEAFSAADLGQGALVRKVVHKGGESEERMSPRVLKEEIRPELESTIAEDLGL